MQKVAVNKMTNDRLRFLESQLVSDDLDECVKKVPSWKKIFLAEENIKHELLLVPLSLKSYGVLFSMKISGWINYRSSATP